MIFQKRIARPDIRHPECWSRKLAPVTNGPESLTCAFEIAAQCLDGLRRYRFSINIYDDLFTTQARRFFAVTVPILVDPGPVI